VTLQPAAADVGVTDDGDESRGRGGGSLTVSSGFV